MGWVKDDAGCSGSHDGTARIAQERYIINGGENPVAICANPVAFLGGADGNTPLPARNSPHPIDPGMLLDCYQTNTDGAVVTITALYSSDRRFRFPTVNSTPNNGFTWELSTIDITNSIPYALKVHELVAVIPAGGDGTGPPQPQYRDIWKFESENIFEAGQRVEMMFSVKPEQVPAALQVVYTRQNAIQLIGGDYWHFEGCSLSQGTRVGDYTMRARWRREAGIPSIGDQDQTAYDPDGNPVNVANILAYPKVSNLLTGGNIKWSKPPYQRVLILPNLSGSPEDKPIFKPILMARFDPSGFEAIAALIP